MAVIQGSCETCAYWDPSGPTGPRSGLCRRRAPTRPNTSVGSGDPDVECRAWPITEKDDWCGMHVPRDRTDARVDGGDPDAEIDEEDEDTESWLVRTIAFRQRQLAGLRQGRGEGDASEG